MRVAVTGGSGVVGRAVVAHLLENGYEVVATSRSAGTDRDFQRIGVTPIRGDVSDVESLAKAFDGCEWVFHIAGMNAMCVRDPQEMWRVNIDGTQNAASVASEVGVSRLIYTSSAAVLGEAPGEIGHEASPHRGSFLSYYEESKFLAERALLDLDLDTEVVIVNPSSVQGPGRATGTGGLILDVINGKLKFLPDGPLSIVDIGDCARGHLAAAVHGEDRARYVLNSFTMDMREAVSMISIAIGSDIEVRYFPPSVGRMIAPVADLLHWMRLPIPFCGEMIKTIAHGHRYDGSLAARELEIAYTTPEIFIERLVEWFRDEGLIES